MDGLRYGDTPIEKQARQECENEMSDVSIDLDGGYLAYQKRQ